MKKRGLFFLIAALLGLVAPIGFATFVVVEDKTADYSVDSGGSLVDVGTAGSVTVDYNDGITDPFDYVYETFSYSDLPTPTGNLSNHTFMGWYSTKTGMDEVGDSTLLDSSYVPSSGDVIYARYKNSDTVSSTISSTISINKNSAKTSNIYYLGSSSGAGEVYITSGGTVQVYYGESSTFSESDSGSDNTIKYLNEADVIVKLDCDLIIDGGTFQLNSVFGGNLGGMSNALSGSFTCLDLNGYTVTLMGGASLNGYGIIYNSGDTGGICVEDATLTTCFTTLDFTGGGNFCLSYIASTITFTNYAVPYLCCEVLLTPNGTINGFTSLYADSKKNNTDFCIIGKKGTSSCILENENGYVIKNTTPYDRLISSTIDRFGYNEYSTDKQQRMLMNPDLYREKLIFTDDPSGHLEYLDVSYPKTYQCQITYSPLVMTLTFEVLIWTYTVTASMQYVEFAVPSWMDMEFYNTKVNLDIAVVFMPGSTCYVDSDSTVNMGSTAGDSTVSARIFGRIAVLDHYAKDTQFNYTSSSKTQQSNLYGGLSSYLDARYILNDSPAKVTMDGKFTFSDTGVDASSSYLQWYAIFGNIDLSDQALKSLQDNYSKVELAPRYFAPINYSTQDSVYGMGVAEYYTSPIASDSHAYFQPGGKCTEIVACEDYDVDAGLYKYNGQWYFYKFDTETSYTGLHMSQSTVISTQAPNASRLATKFANTAGAFTACDVYEIESILGSAKYIEYDGNYRVNIRGAYIQITSEPSVDSYGSFNALTISSNTSNKLYDSAANDEYCVLGTSVYFEPSTQNWRLAYAS